jgi:hypothetical protein
MAASNRGGAEQGGAAVCYWPKGKWGQDGSYKYAYLKENESKKRLVDCYVFEDGSGSKVPTSATDPSIKWTGEVLKGVTRKGFYSVIRAQDCNSSVDSSFTTWYVRLGGCGTPFLCLLAHIVVLP